MAEFYNTGDPETNKLWSKKLWTEWRKADTVFDDRYGLAGSDEDTNAFVVVDEPSKSVGDEVTVTLSLQIAGRGVIGDDVLEGKEMPIDTATFKMKIDEQIQGVKTRGVMNGQRVNFDTFEEAKKRLKDWWKTRRAVSAINHLCGNVAQTDLAYTGLNAVAAPDTQHIYRVSFGLGASNDQTVGGTTTATLDVAHVDELVTIAETLTPAIKPFVIDGNPYYGMFLHPNVVSDIRNKNTQWYAAMLGALQGGRVNDNPLFTRAIGKWRNVLFFSEPHITRGVDSGTGLAVNNTRRNVLFGAGALAISMGRRERGSKEHFTWYSGTWDHGRKYYGSASMVWGVKSPRYTIAGTARDYGKIVVTSYSADRVTGLGDIGQ